MELRLPYAFYEEVLRQDDHYLGFGGKRGWKGLLETFLLTYTLQV